MIAGAGNETLGATLALVNALLNGSSALLLFGGWLSIRRGRRDVHWKLMAGAFTVSCLFLVSYVVRVLVSGTHRYPGSGAWKAIYLAVLTTHMLLAITVPPLALRTLYLAIKRRFAEHRRLVRFTWPIWMYVSVTGVLVYVLLYHPPG
jgi:putative membrane protein